MEQLSEYDNQLNLYSSSFTDINDRIDTNKDNLSALSEDKQDIGTILNLNTEFQELKDITNTNTIDIKALLDRID